MSMVLDEAARLFAKMDITEKARARELLDREVDNSFPGIKRTPGVCGGSACIGNTRIPVWLLWGFHTDGVSDRWLLENYPTLTAEDIANAYAYARAHLSEIEEDIRQNDSDDDDEYGG
jgi:uncharacterized protein (DUF433 family)